MRPYFLIPEIQAIFSDERYMLHIEVALAQVQAALGIIPPDAAALITQKAASFKVDIERLERGMERDGVPTIDFIQQLREHIGGEAASYVHWGATSQDIMDTALILQLREVLSRIEPTLQALIQNLAKLADEHRTTVMAGRTHSQHALPITFGLKVAYWLSPLLRHQQRLAEIKPRLLVIQLGGAAGTLASLGDRGGEVQTALAHVLNLHVPLATWHTQRDHLAEFAGWLSLVTGNLAKMAQDIILMAQSEVDELQETNDPARGGSSTMPQKRNPIISEEIIAAARTNAGLLSAMHQAMIQEHERATGAWQIEWLTLPQMVMLTVSALNRAVFLSENLVVNAARMRENVDSSHGLMLAEALNLALAPHLGRTEAKKLIKTAGEIAITEGRHLVDVVREQVSIEFDWDNLRDESAYLGSTQPFIDRVLKEIKYE